MGILLIPLLCAGTWAADPAPSKDGIMARGRSLAAGLEESAQELRDLALRHAASDDPDPYDPGRQSARERAEDRADRLRSLMEDYSQLDDAERVSRGAALLSDLAAGRLDAGLFAKESARIADPGDFNKVMNGAVARAEQALDFEETAMSEALARAAARRRRFLLAGGGAAVLAAAALAAWFSPRARGSPPAASPPTPGGC